MSKRALLLVSAALILALTLHGTTSVSKPPVPSQTAAAGGPPPLPRGVTLRQIDGGARYYGRFTHGLPDDPSYFPVADWGEYNFTPAHIRQDKAIGINLHVAPSDPASANLPRLRSAGIYTFLGREFWGSSRARRSPAAAGWHLGDEADMTLGPGSDPWDGNWAWNTCTPIQDQGGNCGYTAMAQRLGDSPHDGHLTFAEYGKGVTFWWPRAQAARFVNGYTNVFSDDIYWFTDPDLRVASQGGCFYNGCKRDLTWDQTHRAYNYALTIRRLRYLDGLDGRRQPILGTVEVGWSPTDRSAAEGGRTIEPAELRAAVWQTLIAGARGILYFPFSWSNSPCPTMQIFYDRSGCYTGIQRAAAAVDAQVKALARVLNAPFADHYVTTRGGIDAMAKAASDGHFYVFAGNKTNASKIGVLTLAGRGSGTATVIGERRTVKITRGSFRDEFADGNAIHIYRIQIGRGR